MKRTILFAIIALSATLAHAQTPLSFGTMNGMRPAFRQFPQMSDTNTLRSKWSLNKYIGISAGFSTLFGGTTFQSIPVGFQLNRQLTNNLVAFAGVSVAPTLMQFNRAFYQPKTSFMNANNFGVLSTAELGLMYINNERTFSISGSIGVSRGYYDGYSPFYAPATTPVRK
jgi:hypothetical protein